MLSLLVVLEFFFCANWFRLSQPQGPESRGLFKVRSIALLSKVDWQDWPLQPGPASVTGARLTNNLPALGICGITLPPGAEGREIPMIPHIALTALSLKVRWEFLPLCFLSNSNALTSSGLAPDMYAPFHSDSLIS